MVWSVTVLGKPSGGAKFEPVHRLEFPLLTPGACSISAINGSRAHLSHWGCGWESCLVSE